MTYLAEGDGPDIHPGQMVERMPLVTTVIHGRPSVSFLAICMDCGAPTGRPLPMPFPTEVQRDRWAEGHATTGHNIKFALEIRP